MSGLTDQLAFKISSDQAPQESSGEGNWLRIVQKEIPEEQQIATDPDVTAGIRQLKSGQSAHTAFTGLCPVQFGGTAGNRMAYYTVTFYIHRSADINPEIEVTLGGDVLDVQGPRPGLLRQGKSWIFQKNKTQNIGWRAHADTFNYRWEIAFDDQAQRIFPGSSRLPEVQFDDGIAYIIGDAVTGSAWLSGIAEVDVYTARVGQRVGTKWQGGLYASAYWPAGNERKDQQRITEELFLPQCVVEKIEECSDTIEDLLSQGIDNIEELFSVIYLPIHYDVDDCSGEVLGRTPNTQ